MKKVLGILSLGVLALTLAACGGKKESDLEVLKVGASPTPHGEILEKVKPILKDEGIDLQIEEFTDYVLPDTTLVDGDIDANFFAHIPFINTFNKENGDPLEIVGGVHIEPMAGYSKEMKDISELKDGATILASTNTPDYGRILTILKDAGVITLKDGVNIEEATFDDVAENPKNLKFKYDVSPEMLTSAYENNEADLIFINANYAYQGGLNPVKDSVVIEADGSPYVNVLVTRKGDKDEEKIQKLIKALHKKEIQDWILEKWDGSVKPVSE